jgi:hypothetical protein
MIVFFFIGEDGGLNIIMTDKMEWSTTTPCSAIISSKLGKQHHNKNSILPDVTLKK